MSENVSNALSLVNSIWEFSNWHIRGAIHGMDIDDIRRRRVRQLIDEECAGKNVRFAERIERQPDQVSKWFSENEDYKRNIGEDLARHIETCFEKPRLWLDHLEGQEYPDNPLALVIAGYKAASRDVQIVFEIMARQQLSGGGEKPR